MRQPWRDKLAVLSGGSSGLGLHIAMALAEQGAKLVVIGRDQERLEQAAKKAKAVGAKSVDVFAFDVADETVWQSDSEEIVRWRSFIESNQLDLLLNVVGRSDRGMLSSLNAGDVLSQFQTNVLSTFLMTKACMPSLSQARGTVVNIGSLAGILSGPGMGGYSLSKHALVGMHRQWRLEAHDTGVHFMLVCPGPISREESSGRYDALAESRGLDSKHARPGGGVDLKRLDPKELATLILDGAARRQMELVVPGKARYLAALMALWPSWADQILRKRFQRD